MVCGVRQYNLGVCLGKGRGLPKNVKEAALWYRKAAEQGDSMAQFRLALCLATGKGVEKDLEQAVELYEQAAAQKHGGALFNLGVCFAQVPFSPPPAPLHLLSFSPSPALALGWVVVLVASLCRASLVLCDPPSVASALLRGALFDGWAARGAGRRREAERRQGR